MGTPPIMSRPNPWPAHADVSTPVAGRVPRVYMLEYAVGCRVPSEAVAMKLGELCNRSVVIADREESVRDAARRMRDHHMGCLVVVERSGDIVRPIAMVTDRDLVVSVLADEREHLRELSLKDVMSRPLLAAREDEELYDVVQRMRARGVRRVPVTDAEGRLQGIFTLDDILELVSEQLEGLVGIVQREQRRERDTRPQRD